MPSEEVSGIESYLEEYFDVMVASLFNPVILNDAGVDNAYEISRLALRNFKRSEPFHDLEGKFKKLLIHIDLVWFFTNSEKFKKATIENCYRVVAYTFFLS